MLFPICLLPGATCVLLPLVCSDRLFAIGSPVNMYNSSLRGGNTIRCFSKSLQGEDDVAAAAVCMPCGALDCVMCGAEGLAIRPEFAVAQSEQPWLVFRCPFEGVSFVCTLIECINLSALLTH